MISLNTEAIGNRMGVSNIREIKKFVHTKVEENG